MITVALILIAVFAVIGMAVDYGNTRKSHVTIRRGMRIIGRSRGA